jgi:hypothetical protein
MIKRKAAAIATKRWGKDGRVWLGVDRDQSKVERVYVVGVKHPNVAKRIIPFGMGSSYEEAFDDAASRGILQEY